MAKCIVVYDDQMGLCIPMTADSDCEGAICCGVGPVVVFAEQKLARAAIKISKAYADLLKLQGKIYNDDFTANCKHIKIRPVVEVAVTNEVQK